jgi:hypothetical protein
VFTISTLDVLQALILSEYGVGGGIHQNGSVPAKTAAEAAQLPFFGIWGSYNPATGEFDARSSVIPSTLQDATTQYRCDHAPA